MICRTHKTELWHTHTQLFVVGLGELKQTTWTFSDLLIFVVRFSYIYSITGGIDIMGNYFKALAYTQRSTADVLLSGQLQPKIICVGIGELEMTLLEVCLMI